MYGPFLDMTNHHKISVAALLIVHMLSPKICNRKELYEQNYHNRQPVMTAWLRLKSVRCLKVKSTKEQPHNMHPLPCHIDAWLFSCALRLANSVFFPSILYNRIIMLVKAWVRYD